MDSSNVFADSGPKHMMVRGGAGSSPVTMIDIDWDNQEHRRCIIACLVKGTSVMESDQTEGRLNTCEALAPAWWESFQFNLIEILECACARERECTFCWISRILAKNQCLIYGAVFEYVPPMGRRRHPSAPRYVVAFRGTMLKDPTAARDLCLDASIMLNQQHKCSRFRKAREQVEELMENIANGCATGGSDVWLAGHSLGASIALDVGRNIATKGCYLPTFLFNPPHVSPAPAVDLLGMPDVAKGLLDATSCIVKGVLAKTVLRPHGVRMEALFEKLSPWAPNLYVHERDYICKGFIEYFKQRKQVQEWLPGVAISATTLSYRDMCYSVVGKQNERAHLLPSAKLCKNSSLVKHPLEAHQLQQWWQPKQTLNFELYSWR